MGRAEARELGMRRAGGRLFPGRPGRTGLAARHGDDALAAGRRLGPEAIRLVESAGEQGPAAARLLARHGEPAARLVADPRSLGLCAAHGDDRAATALIRHGGLAEPLVVGLGRPAAKALAALGAATDSAALQSWPTRATWPASAACTPELLAVVARFGDRAMGFIWDHKGALAVSATLAAFLADPRPFLDGAKSLAGTVARPLAEVPGRVAANVASRGLRRPAGRRRRCVGHYRRGLPAAITTITRQSIVASLPPHSSTGPPWLRTCPGPGTTFS